MKLGLLGLGQRGYTMLEASIVHFDVNIVAVCDLYEDRVENAQKLISEKMGQSPKGFTNADEFFAEEMDAVLIMTSWESHVSLAITAMKKGIVTGLEVGGAYSVDDCFALVRAYEETKTPFMMMENCCFGKDELLATAMARKGMFGEIVHCSGKYGHDLRYEVSNGEKLRHYRLRNYLNRNCENYPTHELLPIAKLLNINRGNRMVSLVSVASKAAGVRDYIAEHKDEIPAELHNATFKQGDIIDTIITCANGETIRLCLDTTLPRFYDRGFTVRGTKGMYMQTSNSVILDGKTPEYWEPALAMEKLLNNAKEYEEHLPAVWKEMTEEKTKVGHGGMDGIELAIFFDCVENKKEMPIDVYDAASAMVISVLSEASIAQGGAPMTIPDFTSGAWISRKPKDVVEL